MARKKGAEIEKGGVRDQNTREVEQTAGVTAFKEKEIGGIVNG